MTATRPRSGRLQGSSARPETPRSRISGLAHYKIQAQILEIEVSGDPEPDVVRDDAGAPELEHRVALRTEELAPQALEVLRARLDRAVVAVVEAGAEAVAAEAVRTAEALAMVPLAHLSGAEAGRRPPWCLDLVVTSWWALLGPGTATVAWRGVSIPAAGGDTMRRG